MAQQFTISGFVRDSYSGTPVAGALVYELGSGNATTTNDLGFYQFVIPGGRRVVYFRAPRYLDAKDTIFLGKSEFIDVQLEPLTDYEVDKSIDLPSAADPIYMNPVRFNQFQLKAMPHFFCEPDLVKPFQLTPGVQTGLDGSANLLVRGGSNDQNLMLIDGFPVYNSNHAFGFVSPFHNRNVTNINLQKSGFSAMQGGRLSSVMDIQLAEGDKYGFAGNALISLLSFSALIEGPLWEGKTSFILGLRRTLPGIIDLLNPVSRGSANEVQSSYYYDINLKVVHQLNRKTKLSLLIINNRDQHRAVEETGSSTGSQTTIEETDRRLFWTNTLMGLQLSKQMNASTFARFALSYNSYQYRINEQFERRIANGSANANAFAGFLSGVRDIRLSADYDKIKSSNHRLRYGAHLTQHLFSPASIAVRAKSASQSIDTALGFKSVNQAQQAAVYFEDEWKVSSVLKVLMGLRYSAYNTNGSFYHMPEPRLSTRLQMNDNLSLKASVTRMAQYLHQVNNTGSILISDFWLPSTARVKPQSAMQYTLGLESRNKSSQIVSIEAYYKTMKNLVDYGERQPFFDVRENWEQLIDLGNGRSYGIEAMYRKEEGAVRGWLAYTLSWNFRQFPDINSGREYAFRYDRRHQVSSHIGFEINDDNIVGLNLAFGTGYPITFPVGRYIDLNGNEVYDFGEKNSYQLDYYLRADVSYTNLRESWYSNNEQVFMISVYNLFNRFNPNNLRVERNGAGDLVVIETSFFPLIPGVTYILKF